MSRQPEEQERLVYEDLESFIAVYSKYNNYKTEILLPT